MFCLESKPLTYGILVRRAKHLMGGLARTGGRNNFGRITSFKKGGGKYRRMVRFIDF